MMTKESVFIPETGDEMGLHAKADTVEGAENVDEPVGVAETDDELVGAVETNDEPLRAAETEDEFPVSEGTVKLSGKSWGNKKEKKSGTENSLHKKFNIGNRTYYRKTMKELIPWLLAILILLAVTQTAAGILWNRQEKRLETLYETYGAEYGQE